MGDKLLLWAQKAIKSLNQIFFFLFADLNWWKLGNIFGGTFYPKLLDPNYPTNFPNSCRCKQYNSGEEIEIRAGGEAIPIYSKQNRAKVSL